MGTATPALLIQALVVAVSLATISSAHAEPCTGITGGGGRFATCFDLGNRLSVTAGSDGVGGAIALRHVIGFDDEPDLVWKLEHVIADATHGSWQERFSGALYRGRFLRHTRHGHIVLPLGTPKKVFLPFDIGGLVEAGTVRWAGNGDAAQTLRIGVVKTAALFDFARTRSFQRRFAIGPVARWDVDVDRGTGSLGAVDEHAVSLFSTLMADLHLASRSGVLAANVRIEAGTVWHSDTGWVPEAVAEATVERIVLAVNDRPIALVLGFKYETATEEAIARVGARIVLFHRADARVNLRPLRTAAR